MLPSSAKPSGLCVNQDILWQDRRVGESEVWLPPLGFGAAAIGNLYSAVTAADAMDAVTAALNSGVHYFDTAPLYGFGLSETRLGLALSGSSAGAGVRVSTKVGRRLVEVPGDALPAERQGFVDALPFAAVFDYSYDGVMRSFEDSLRRLGGTPVSLLLAHDLGRATHGALHAERFREFIEGGYRAMQSLRAQGTVGAIGLGVNEVEVCMEAMQVADFDCFLVAGRYTLLDQTAIEVLLPECEKRSISVVLGGPFNSGVLVDTSGRNDNRRYNYAPASRAVLDRVSRLSDACAGHGVPLAAAALQFPLGHAAIVSVIPGIATREQMLQAIEFAQIPIPQALWKQLKHEGLLHPLAPIPNARSPG
jgi:D-threo-aldose 1-dehydrogenase